MEVIDALHDGYGEAPVHAHSDPYTGEPACCSEIDRVRIQKFGIDV